MDKKHADEIKKCTGYKDSKQCIADGCYFYFPIKKCGVNYIKISRDQRNTGNDLLDLIKRSKKNSKIKKSKKLSKNKRNKKLYKKLSKKSRRKG